MSSEAKQILDISQQDSFVNAFIARFILDDDRDAVIAYMEDTIDSAKEKGILLTPFMLSVLLSVKADGSTQYEDTYEFVKDTLYSQGSNAIRMYKSILRK